MANIFHRVLNGGALEFCVRVLAYLNLIVGFLIAIMIAISGAIMIHNGHIGAFEDDADPIDFSLDVINLPYEGPLYEMITGYSIFSAGLVKGGLEYYLFKVLCDVANFGDRFGLKKLWKIRLGIHIVTAGAILVLWLLDAPAR